MWGLACDMDAIMKVARKHKLLVVEDACQGVGGGYKGRMLGAIGHAGAYSFNYYKNMTAGEGGAFVTNDERVLKRGSCAVDCCNFYWMGRDPYTEHFTYSGSRATEVMAGASQRATHAHQADDCDDARAEEADTQGNGGHGADADPRELA